MSKKKALEIAKIIICNYLDSCYYYTQDIVYIYMRADLEDEQVPLYLSKIITDLDYLKKYIERREDNA